VKLLFGQNLSPFLCRSVQDLFPGSVHVREIGLLRATDSDVWDYASRNGFTIVTKDADFRQRSFLLGHPPKVIWVRLGNCSTRLIEGLLRGRAAELEQFNADQQKSIYGLF
jgi:predicted nuclease of predicted toxin-antitoxin system